MHRAVMDGKAELMGNWVCYTTLASHTYTHTLKKKALLESTSQQFLVRTTQYYNTKRGKLCPHFSAPEQNQPPSVRRALLEKIKAELFLGRGEHKRARTGCPRAGGGRRRRRMEGRLGQASSGCFSRFPENLAARPLGVFGHFCDTCHY